MQSKLKTKIAFLDIEVNPNNEIIESLGLFMEEVCLKTTSISKVKDEILKYKPQFICGHNFIDHDKKFLVQTSFGAIFENIYIIDTLYLSMLLYPTQRFHKLEKPYKNELDIENQPLEDARLTNALFLLLDSKFDALNSTLKAIFVDLLFDEPHFNGYFIYKGLQKQNLNIYAEVKRFIVCQKDEFDNILEHNKVEIALIISFVYFKNKASFSFIILNLFPEISKICQKLLFNANLIDLEKFAFDEFGIKTFKKFDSTRDRSSLASLIDAQISQKDIICSALKGESLLAILPTGGGKTFTFQLPALIKANICKTLSVVISPLQALMKNQVDGFKNKNNNFCVKAISGYLNPLERSEILSQVREGFVDILYITPEALRSNSIFNALKRRVIERFIIDEAHCFSTWGHDFRHDYYFIADIISELEKSKYQPKIAVSCFTATAKMAVIDDIEKYFKNKLQLSLNKFIASSERHNLKYEVIEVESIKAKYDELLKIIKMRSFDSNGAKITNPTIIYIPQNASECKRLSKKLQGEIICQGLGIEPFYAKLDDDKMNGKRSIDSRDKSQILNDFIDDKIDIVIATTAFGMGIDKPNIMTIIHYEQSDSLESYMQESGRGARDSQLEAKCIVLYNKNEFNKNFIQLNRSKIEYGEILKIARVLQSYFKKYKKDSIAITKKDIAKGVGIDIEDSNIDWETMVDTAILELEKCKIVKRKRNSTRIFATSLIKNEDEMPMQTIHKRLEKDKKRLEKIKYGQKEIDMYSCIIRIMQNIIQRSKRNTAIDAEELAELVEIDKNDIFAVLYECQKYEFVDFYNDISVFIKDSVKNDIKEFFTLENKLFESIEKNINFKHIDLCEKIDIKLNKKGKNIAQISRQILQSWIWLSASKKMKFSTYFKNNICYFEIDSLESMHDLIKMRQEVCLFIIEQLLQLLKSAKKESSGNIELEFSSTKLKIKFDRKYSNQKEKISLDGFHHCLVFLHNMLVDFKLHKGRLIYYQSYNIQKIIQQNENQIKLDRNTPYYKADYNDSLAKFYVRKVESIHILILFLEKVLKNGYEKAKTMMIDYFSLAYDKFLEKYFDESQRKLIKIPLTQEKYNEILHNLDSDQQQIFSDKTSESILVLAGPGSGKTKTLVHKIAHLIMIEHKKPEYFLMLAHSRAAVAEFKERIKNLVGNEIYNMRIFTFHAFALHILGERVNNDDELKDALQKATKSLNNNEIELPFIQMLVIDEFQDIGEKSYAFIKAIYNKMPKGDKKIIAVGDDDQCIKNFGEDKAQIGLMQNFKDDFSDKGNKDEPTAKESNNFMQYFLLTNYRSKANIVHLVSEFRQKYISQYFKLKNKNLIAKSNDNGEISITFYNDSCFIKNMTQCVKKEMQNNQIASIALLFRTNDEVLLAYSALLESGIKAKYLLDSNGFDIGNLVEIQDFGIFLTNMNFESALVEFKKQYQKSKNYNLANRVIRKFQSEYSQYLSHKDIALFFMDYAKEICLEEFLDKQSRVVVSTMHKAKGKEFDAVYIGIENEFCKKDSSEYDTRLLYVALTRAKVNLHIHTKNKKLFEILKPHTTNHYIYNSKDDKLRKICILMTLEDIKLADKCNQTGIKISKPLAGEKCTIKQESTKEFIFFNIYKDSHRIATLSQSFRDKILEKISQGYTLDSEVEIEYICYWSDKKLQNDKEMRYKEILCKISLVKNA